MTPLRASVLVFAIGASVVNFLAVKARIDQPTANFSATFDMPSPSPAATRASPDLEREGQLVEIYDRAWIREAIIVTIAGIAWFLIRAKESSA